MSAYICAPSHIGILAAYAAVNDCAIYEWSMSNNNILTAQNVAKGLALENIRSVAHRYPRDKDGQRPGPWLKDADIVEACQIYAGHFAKRLGGVVVMAEDVLEPIQVLKLVRSLDYQSCETDDWPMTLAARQLEWISGEVISRLPGYEDADWSFSGSLPEVQALYAKEG
jgi:hypothetical protein